jgi:hypothetical protein
MHIRIHEDAASASRESLAATKRYANKARARGDAARKGELPAHFYRETLPSRDAERANEDVENSERKSHPSSRTPRFDKLSDL